MTREEKLQKAHQMFDNRNLLLELKWQREHFKRGYISNQEELFNLWIFDECIKALEQEPKSEWQKDHEILKAYSDGSSEVLDKIRGEIEELYSYVEFDEDTKTSYNMVRLEEVQRVIDKYKGESM
jgi:hypothetical protein